MKSRALKLIYADPSHPPQTGRVAMLAAAGSIFQDIYTFQGTETLTGGAKMTGAHDAIVAAAQSGNQKAL